MTVSHVSTERTRTRVDARVARQREQLGAPSTSVLRGSAVPSASVTSSARQRPSSCVSRMRRFSGSLVTVLDPDATRALAVVLAHDELLRDVDETTGQVAGVGGTERGVGETLAGTVRRDEVLEDRQALTEVRLDRARDDLATRVGHETAHAGDLAHLHDVSAGTRADHHVDGVELLASQLGLHGFAHLVGGVGPDLDLLLAPLVVGDDAAVVLLSTLSASPSNFSRSPAFCRRRLDVGDRDGEPGTASTYSKPRSFSLSRLSATSALA